ncbi:hypothetical protein CI109_106828 [Kwoniella shandongensis]|uniref:Uncharacterized protein n=1 Tax=Kwoniella shandongensis TaxID=1734106 RepID=A0A5M6C6I7_9TREE|nr:uncharacterized protein CI109_000916 [Kwoniella shandongensis]KAA5530736.1 hypothetical protein CI109_000916 [Kwoniella shandongensis]
MDQPPPSAHPATAAAQPKKEKVVPPDPPLIIKDRERGWNYTRVGFLGEGGFARVFEVQDPKGSRKAVKVVTKASIKTKKNKTKLWAEIKLHQMLNHPHVVRFEDCFEDEENVYMVLELCENGSLMDMLRRRKRYTEPEARYYLVQLIAACQYMHQTNVIHRDLKLGNLFLDVNMDIKVGDLGLAALIEKPGDRKKTICGTPNYIAPEVLFDTANGHSFEVDIWSVGVILYTLLIGRPPFQTKDVKAIYKRIRENRYEFPQDKEISSSAQELIMTILNTDPDKRPTLEAILSHRWFLDGPFPASIPASANDFAPDFRNVSLSQSRRNFQNLCRRAKIGVDIPINTEPPRPRTALGPSIMQQERDFKNAVQPDSPISALLNSARQPLVQAPTAIKEPSLLRKLSAAGAASTLSPARKTAYGKENGAAGPSSARRHTAMERVGEEEEEEELAEAPNDAPRGQDRAVQERELATQKARIVSQMAGERHTHHHHHPLDRNAASPRRAAPLSSATTLPRAPTAAPRERDIAPGKTKEFKSSLFETFGQNLAHALSKAETEAGFWTPQIKDKPAAPKVFIVSWLDYCTKYGMGFVMTDGSVGAHFNDSETLVYSPNMQYFDDIRPAEADDRFQTVRRNHSIDRYPSDLTNKVYLLKYFHQYMMDRLFSDHPWTYYDESLTTGMVFVVKFLRMKHVVLFRLSNDVLQFNFLDHVKLILSHEGLVVSVIDKDSVLRTWSLAAILRPLEDDVPSKERKRIEDVRHKLNYARDVLAKVKSHGSSSSRPTKPSQVPVSANTRGATERDRELFSKPIR